MTSSCENYSWTFFDHELLRNFRLLSSSAAVQARCFLLEFNEWEDWEGLEDDVALAKSRGFRTFAATRLRDAVSIFTNKSISAGKSPVLQLRVSQALKDKVMAKGAQWAREVLQAAN